VLEQVPHALLESLSAAGSAPGLSRCARAAAGRWPELASLPQGPRIERTQSSSQRCTRMTPRWTAALIIESRPNGLLPIVAVASET